MRSAERKRGSSFSKKLLRRQLGAYTGERARIYNQLIAQVKPSPSPYKTIQLIAHCRIWFRLPKPTSSSTVTIVATLDSFQKMAIYSILAPRTFSFASTTPQIHTTGDSLNPQDTTTDNGRLRMPICRRITDSLPIAVLQPKCVLQAPLLMKTTSKCLTLVRAEGEIHRPCTMAE